MSNVSTKYLLLALVPLVFVAFFLFSFIVPQKTPAIASFEECAAAGYPIMESYPEQCRTPEGVTFVRIIPAADSTVPPTPTNTPPATSNDDLNLQANGCAVAGCSGQLCVSADEAGDMVTTCEYREEYACYKEAACEPQADGKCGWTLDAAAVACLEGTPTREDIGL